MKLVSLFAFSLLVLCQGKPFQLQWTLLKASVNTQPLDPPVITNCTKPTDVGEINSVTFDPAEPKQGDTLTITASFALKENVTSGTIKVTAKFDGIPIINNKVFDLCEVAKLVGLACPLAFGTHSFQVSVEIPGFVQKGTYSGEGVITQQDDKEVACGKGIYKL